jgi:hypothetical protein
MLEPKEIAELSLVNKQVNKLLKPFETKQIAKKQHNAPKPKKQSKSPPTIEIKITNDTYKLSVYDLKTVPKFIFNETAKNWQYIPQTSERVIPTIDQSSYAGFKSKLNGKNMFFVHRGLVDRSLEYYKGGLDDEGEQDYEELYNGKQFIENFDFTSP